MGCAASTDRKSPSGDGDTGLYWSPDDNARKLAGTIYVGARESKMWFNQEAIFNKLLGHEVDVLPYPPDDNARQLAGTIYEGARESKMWFN